MRLIDFFDRGVERYPERDCLHDGSRGWTYREISGWTHRIANGLLALGLQRQQVASVYSPNHANAYAALLGIVRAGLSWAPVNARNGLDENIYILNNVDCVCLFYHSSFEHYLPRLRAECPKIKHYICVDKQGADTPFLMDWLSQQKERAPDLPDNPDEI